MLQDLPVLRHTKWQNQLYTLHRSSIYRRHYRMRPSSIMSLATEALFVDFLFEFVKLSDLLAHVP